MLIKVNKNIKSGNLIYKKYLISIYVIVEKHEETIMVKPVSGASGNNPPDGYNKVTMYDEGSKKTKTFFVPVGQKLTVNGNTYDLDKAKGNELVFKGTKDNTKHNLMGIALEYLDANGDGRIDSKDTDQDMAGKINKKLSNTPYFVKNNDVFSDAGIFKGEGGVVISLDGEGQFFGVDIEKK